MINFQIFQERTHLSYHYLSQVTSQRFNKTVAILLFAMAPVFLAESLQAKMLDAQDKPTIYWGHYPFAPIYIDKGEQRGQGIADQAIRMIQQAMPEYHHQNYSSSFTRIIRSFEDKGVNCTGMNKTAQRAEHILFSTPAVLFPSHTLNYLKSRQQALEKSTGLDFRQAISLETLLQSPSADAIGHTQNRAYSAQINSLLDAHQDKVRTFAISTSLGNIFKQITYKRISYTIEYPFVTFFWLQELGMLDQIGSVALNESGKGFNGYIACTNNSEGKQAIKHINKVLARIGGTDKHRNLVERWLPPELIFHYRKLYRDFFDTQY